MTIDQMVEEFQCPGCVLGSDTSCGSYNYDANELRCISHVCGTMIGFGNTVALGLPKGFNKTGWHKDGTPRNKMSIRLYPEGQKPAWDHLNVPVWAMEENGFLFVRTFAPRIDATWVDVIEGGNMGMVPESTIDVGEFVDEID